MIAPRKSQLAARDDRPTYGGMDSFFTTLGRTVLAEWKKVNFSPARFPGIAREALEARPPARHVDLAALIRDFLLDDEQPLQSHSGFGQPELIVFDDPRLYIQILFWLEGTTDIHQHTFSGAFHVLAGSSIQSRFIFENAEPISAHIQVGDLRLTETRLLETGSTVPIDSGRGCIHSLFHLDTPSLTVVVRTHTDPGTGPQFTYLPPHLAVDPFHDDTLTHRRKQLLDVLEQTEDPSYADAVREMIGALDFERGFFVLQNCLGYLRRTGEWEESWERFRLQHGRLAGFVAPTLDEIVRRDSMVEMRRAITAVEHRFFLALLLNVPARAAILELVAKRFGGPPAETVVRWAGELGESSEFGSAILDAVFPAELALPEPEQAGVFLAALRHFVVGGSETNCATLPAKILTPLRKAFAASALRALVS